MDHDGRGGRMRKTPGPAHPSPLGCSRYRSPTHDSAPPVLNRTWALDFMSETLYDGRRVRLLTVIDEGNREGLEIAMGLSVPRQGVVRVLNELAASALPQHAPLRSARQHSTQPDGVKKPHIRTVGPVTTSVHVVRRWVQPGDTMRPCRRAVGR